MEFQDSFNLSKHEMPKHSFTCNICGSRQQADIASFGRETPTCGACHSTVRYRALIHNLSLALFDRSVILPDFPKNSEIRGVGMSDWDGFAVPLAQKLDYTRTYFDHEPRLDLKNLNSNQEGRYDFVLCSEVLEHVETPVEPAFTGLAHLLKPNGVLVLTVPYQINTGTIEHFPNLHEYSVTQIGSSYVLVNRTKDGIYEVFDKLNFHGGIGATLEMRIFGEPDLMRDLSACGFEQVTIEGEDYPQFGILFQERWSLPILARKQRVSRSKE
jgi:SAM-dependent methyltransferase